MTREVALTAIYQPVELLIDLLARQRLAQATNLADRMDSVAYLADALEHSPSLSALYIGYGNGDFFLLRPLLDNAAVRAQFKAPAAAAYLVQSIERDRAGAARGTYVFLDKAQKVIERRDAPDYLFDPRTRGWYQQAIAAERQVKTAPYVFFSTGGCRADLCAPLRCRRRGGRCRSDASRPFPRSPAAAADAIIGACAFQRRWSGARLRQA